jgi:flagellar biosynthesis/type III secretory pathway protein FliH
LLQCRQLRIINNQKKMDSFKKSKANEAMLEQFQKVYREAYNKGYNDGLDKAKELFRKIIQDGK